MTSKKRADDHNQTWSFFFSLLPFSDEGEITGEPILFPVHCCWHAFAGRTALARCIACDQGGVNANQAL
jgi:hypothetical protein